MTIMMRRLMRLCENANLLPITRPFVRKVRAQCDRIAADIADDLPKDDQQFAEHIHQVIARIEAEEPLAPTMTVVRAELRPAAEVPDGVTGVGAHWSWSENGARVYHHDNAYDEYGRDDNNLVEVVIVAQVPFNGIDWPFTIATNLILPGEQEITIKSGATVKLIDLFTNNELFDANGRAVVVDGTYDMD